MIDVLSLAELDTKLHKASHREYAGPCPDPSCGCQHDGFRVRWFEDDGRWGFMCRGCWDASEYLPEQDRKRGWVDTIAYLRHYRGMSYHEAKRFLSEDTGEGESKARHMSPSRRVAADFQSRAEASTIATITLLWGSDTTGLL